MELFVDELVCFQRYLRASFHVRPVTDLAKAFIMLDGQRIDLTITPSDGFILLTADSLTNGIQKAHEAAVTLIPRQRWGSGKPVTFSNLVTGENGATLNRYDRFYALMNAAHHQTQPKLQNWRVLEIGSRTRDATKGAWDLRSSAQSYVGMDILAGPNVDVVGDAHELSSLVGEQRFDFIYSQYVFEHLAMPWLVATEMNKVMHVGAQALLLSNQSIGLHDIPWDFFRFSESAWRALFNEATGFEVIDTALGDAVRLTPIRYHLGFIDHQGGAGFQASCVWLRKTADKALQWPTAAKPVLERLSRPYPEQITD